MRCLARTAAATQPLQAVKGGGGSEVGRHPYLQAGRKRARRPAREAFQLLQLTSQGLVVHVHRSDAAHHGVDLAPEVPSNHQALAACREQRCTTTGCSGVAGTGRWPALRMLLHAKLCRALLRCFDPPTHPR